MVLLIPVGNKPFPIAPDYSASLLSTLPESLLHYILLQLDLRSAVIVAATCKPLHNKLFSISAQGVLRSLVAR